MSQETANSKLEKLVETLSQLTVLDLSELKTMLESKWGVKAAAAAVAVAAGPVPAAAEAVEEATEFNVILKEADASKKMAIIKTVREVTGLGLKEAKDLVESAPKEVKTHASKAEAQDLKKKLEEAGAVVECKGCN